MCFAGEDGGDYVVVYGDTRTGHKAHRGIVRAILKTSPVAVFHVGDLVTDGRVPRQWERFNEIAGPLYESAAFFPALGNHENDSPIYFDTFDLPNNERWYAVDVGGVHFVVLDSNSDIASGSEQYAWLEAELKASSHEAGFTVVVLHHPPYSTGSHREDEKGLRASVVPLFERYGVEVVFAGHDHDYERSVVKGINYVVTGGGGAPLRGREASSPYSVVFLERYNFCRLRVLDGRLLVEALDEGSNLLDSFAAAPR